MLGIWIDCDSNRKEQGHSDENLGKEEFTDEEIVQLASESNLDESTDDRMSGFWFYCTLYLEAASLEDGKLTTSWLHLRGDKEGGGGGSIHPP